MKIKISTDSTADLSKELYAKYDIGVTPLIVTLGDRDCFDGVNVVQEDIFAYVKATGKLPKTAALNYTQYFEKFKEYKEKGYDAVIHFNISSEMSVTHTGAKSASKDLENVYAVDSASLSTGTGIQAIYAAELVKQGLGFEEIIKRIEERKHSVAAAFVVDRLDYLHKGGRCSSVAVLGANLLKIKPCIEVHNGKMIVARKYRGALKKVIETFVVETLEKYNTPDLTRVFITHTKIDSSYVDMVKELIQKHANFKEIIETDTGCTVTCHCGENTIGIMYYNDGKK